MPKISELEVLNLGIPHSEVKGMAHRGLDDRFSIFGEHAPLGIRDPAIFRAQLVENRTY